MDCKVCNAAFYDTGKSRRDAIEAGELFDQAIERLENGSRRGNGRGGHAQTLAERFAIGVKKHGLQGAGATPMSMARVTGSEDSGFEE